MMIKFISLFGIADVIPAPPPRKNRMPKFRKKPVEIEAVQWTGKNHRPMCEFLTGNTGGYMSVNGTHFEIDHDKIEGGLVIKTLEGDHLAKIGDFIIKGIKGEFYPCKPDIFEATYEEVIEEKMTYPTEMI